jgi:integrase
VVLVIGVVERCLEHGQHPIGTGAALANFLIGGWLRPVLRLVALGAALPSLYVRVTDKGQKSFVLVRRYPGSKNPTPRTLGEYGAMTLNQARVKARQWLDMLARGFDPAIQEEQSRSAELTRQVDTFAAVFEDFVKRHLSTLRTGWDVEVAMRRVLLPKWGKRPISTINRKDVIAAVYEVYDGGAPVSANRLLAYVKTFFAWCVERGRLDASPAALVKKPAKERSRDRVLTSAEIKFIWNACEGCGAVGRAVRFMLCTAARRGEVGGVTWAEIDRSARLWRLPSSRTKVAKSHELPLNDAALECLGEVRGQFVFSNDGGATAINGWSKAKAKLDRLVAEEHPDAVRDTCTI